MVTVRFSGVKDRTWLAVPDATATPLTVTVATASATVGVTVTEVIPRASLAV